MNRYYEVEAVSNSGMSHICPIQGGTPKRYKKNVIDKEGPVLDSPSIENGKLIHLYVEDPSQFKVADVIKPTEKLANWVDEVYKQWSSPEFLFDEKPKSLEEIALEVMPKYGNTKDPEKILSKWKEAKPYLDYLLDTQDTPSELVLNKAQDTIINNVIHSLQSHKQAKSLLFDKEGEVYNELAVYWTEVVDNVAIPCKALLDRLIIDDKNAIIKLVDLKTTAKKSILFADTMEFRRYHRQLAWYKKAIVKWLEQKNLLFDLDWKIECYFVIVETTPLYETRVRKLSFETLDEGKKEYQQCLKNIAYGYNNGWEQFEYENEIPLI